jgi:uncharacterized membrane protein
VTWWREPASLLLLLLLAGCGSSTRAMTDGGASGAGGHTWTTLEERPCAMRSASSYEDFGAPFFSDYCQRCHGSAQMGAARNGAPEAVSFDDVASIRHAAAMIWHMAADQNRAMPPTTMAGGGPSAAERTRLGEWLACGAPTRADLGK